jgi:TnpA family transposase
LWSMPVEFLTDDEAAEYGRYSGCPSQADLERVFFLDDHDRALVGRHRGEHMRAGFAFQLVTGRWTGMFLEDLLDVPVEVLDFVAGQLEVADPLQVKRYTERAKTCHRSGRLTTQRRWLSALHGVRRLSGRGIALRTGAAGQ